MRITKQTIMITLEGLRKIKEKAAFEKEVKQQRLEKERLDEYEKEYQDVITGLEDNLREAAIEEKNGLVVAHFSVFSGGNLTSTNFRAAYSNFYMAWTRMPNIKQEILNRRSGNFQRVYDYCTLQNLKPEIEYWTDGNGQSEGIQIVINW